MYNNDSFDDSIRLSGYLVLFQRFSKVDYVPEIVERKPSFATSTECKKKGVRSSKVSFIKNVQRKFPQQTSNQKVVGCDEKVRFAPPP